MRAERDRAEAEFPAPDKYVMIAPIVVPAKAGTQRRKAVTFHTGHLIVNANRSPLGPRFRGDDNNTRAIQTLSPEPAPRRPVSPS